MLFTLLPMNSHPRTEDIKIRNLIVAGWTGRDRDAMERHIVELEELGIARPKSLPVFYRCSASCVTQADAIQVPGSQSSGEVEFIFFQGHPDGDDGLEGDLWFGVGSDHTERAVEAVGVTISKQMCDKPIGKTLWRFKDIADHWDSLILRSHAVIDGERILYQEGTVTAMIHPLDLIAQYDRDVLGGANGGGLPGDTAIFGGTFAAIGGIRPAARFEMELEDPVTGRSIQHAYDIEELPVEG